MTNSNCQPEIYRFADLTLDAGQQTLVRAGRAVDLSKKSYEFLVALVRGAPNLLSHEDVVQQVWGGRWVSPETVTQRVKLLRDALGDNAKHPRYVQVVRGRGYRLIPQVFSSASKRAIPARFRLTAFGLGVSLLMAVLVIFRPADFPSNPTVQAVPSIAVLPFEDLSDDPNSYFADALHNDLLTYLAKLDGLKVISRNSVLEYRDHLTSLREIGRQLDVETVLEGSVQRSGETVRINVQLVDTERDEHIWAEIYDREFSAENIFSIQSEMSLSIARALRTELTLEEIARVEALPTTSTRAYEAYLAGTEYLKSPNDFFGERSGAAIATGFFERATAEDPQFGLAWAALARSHAAMFFFEFDPSRTRLEMAEQAMRLARTFAPDAPETRIAMGQYYYHGFREYDKALQEFLIAEQLMPGASDLHATKAFIYRRRGDFSRAVVDMQKAIDLDPRNEELLNQQGLSYEFLRDYENAEKVYDRLDETWPDIGPRVQESHFAWLAVRRDGDVGGIKALAENLSATRDIGQWFNESWTAAIYERDFATAFRSLDHWNDEAEDWAINRYVSKDALYAVTARLAGDETTAIARFRAAREKLQPVLRMNPDVARLQVALAEVHAGLGDNDLAIQMAQRAMELMPASRDALNAPRIRLDAILRALIPAGAHGAAIEQLDIYLSQPGQWSIEGLLPDPRLDPIRDDLRFQALIDKHQHR